MDDNQAEGPRPPLTGSLAPEGATDQWPRAPSPAAQLVQLDLRSAALDSGYRERHSIGPITNRSPSHTQTAATSVDGWRASLGWAGATDGHQRSAAAEAARVVAARQATRSVPRRLDSGRCRGRFCGCPTRIHHRLQPPFLTDEVFQPAGLRSGGALQVAGAASRYLEPGAPHAERGRPRSARPRAPRPNPPFRVPGSGVSPPVPVAVAVAVACHAGRAPSAARGLRARIFHYRSRGAVDLCRSTRPLCASRRSFHHCYRSFRG